MHGYAAAAARKPNGGLRPPVPRADRWSSAASIAVLLLVVGGVWFFQGIGVIEGSFMTGDALWAVIGVVCVAAGIALLVTRPSRSE